MASVVPLLLLLLLLLHPFNSPLGLRGWAGTRKVKSVWIYWSKR